MVLNLLYSLTPFPVTFCQWTPFKLFDKIQAYTSFRPVAAQLKGGRWGKQCGEKPQKLLDIHKYVPIDLKLFCHDSFLNRYLGKTARGLAALADKIFKARSLYMFETALFRI